ncbi:MULTISPECIES: hypothetical protein [unclassified Amycolatopsis]|uniref:hypothetical protein n=1 Tax=unclassified Amycolatopsis TaxID=2618356 RepID=UPI002E2369BA|nr:MULTISPECIES: hypothetical protein [unclassified Amycolatopsis]
MDTQPSSGFPFADRVAEVVDAGKSQGYLFVTVPEIASTTASGAVTYVDMDFARRDPEQPGGWRYEDRADPGTESAMQELEAAELDWYGEKFGLRWLDGEEAARIRHEVFD